MDTQELQSKVTELTKQVEDLKRLMESHTHSGNDGSTYIYQDSVRQKTQQAYQIGSFAMSEYSGTPPGLGSVFVNRGFLVIGKDEILQDGFDNAQLTIEHQPTTDGTTNQSFFYGYRGRVYQGFKGIIEAGSSTLSQKEFEFVPNSLVGLQVNYLRNDGVQESYSITSNDKNSITINGTWSITQAEGSFFIFIPIYLGGAEYPWRRVYVADGTGGGVRFGYGSTNEGQNGLLYMSGENLVWRSPSGTTTTIA